MARKLDLILKLDVPVIVQIAHRQMDAQDVMSLAPGAIIELPKEAEEELDILVSNKIIGAGRAVKVGENFGIRVTYIGDLEQRINALGGGQADGAGDGAAGDDGEMTAEEAALVDALVGGGDVVDGQSPGGDGSDGASSDADADADAIDEILADQGADARPGEGG